MIGLAYFSIILGFMLLFIVWKAIAYVSIMVFDPFLATILSMYIKIHK